MDEEVYKGRARFETIGLGTVSLPWTLSARHTRSYVRPKGVQWSW